MNRYLRFCIIFMISLALPLSGMTGMQTPTEPCPMKTMGMAMMDGMGMDCCNDMKSPSEHGKPYQPGQECKTVRIPRPSGHLFHEHPATDSTVIRPPVPRSSGHP